MIKATKEILNSYNELFEKRKQEILNTKDSLSIKGTAYYVSNSGDDNNDGKSENTPWKSFNRVSSTDLKSGDGVFFRRGDIFRGSLKAKSGVTYGAYGEGEKPKFYAADKPLNDKDLWELYDKEHNIWKLKEKTLDMGTIVFNGGEAHSRKLIPTFKNLKYVCRDNENKDFDVRTEMTEDLDIFWYYDSNLTTKESKGENFPIPSFDCDNPEISLGDLYLRCDRGNPGEVFQEIEGLARRHSVFCGSERDVTIDNICFKYIGMHGIAANVHVINLTVTNCEFGWIGGCIQTFLGTDPNYPQGGRGTVTRFGNAIEIYGGCDGYKVHNNYIYEVYDAGITHQVTTRKKLMMENIEYSHNLIEKCVYGIEYFLDQVEGERESCMKNVVMHHNFIRLSGYGWGQQRHNTDTPALIKGWSYVNTAENHRVEDNIFDRSAYRMLHLVALKDEYCPEMKNNTYIQNIGGTLGQYGGNEVEEPRIIKFDQNAEDSIKNIFGDKTAKIYYIEE